MNIPLPAGEWDICVNGEKAGCASLGTAVDSVSVDGISAMVLVQGDETVKSAGSQTTSAAAVQKAGNGGFVGAIIASLVTVVAAVAGITVYRKKKKTSKK